MTLRNFPAPGPTTVMDVRVIRLKESVAFLNMRDTPKMFLPLSSLTLRSCLFQRPVMTSWIVSSLAAQVQLTSRCQNRLETSPDFKHRTCHEIRPRRRPPCPQYTTLATKSARRKTAQISAPVRNSRLWTTETRGFPCSLEELPRGPPGSPAHFEGLEVNECTV